MSDRSHPLAEGAFAGVEGGGTTAGSARWRIVTAASIGNALEWFDLLVYGYLAVTFSRLFFPTGDETVSLLLALGTFGVSYLVRPLGAVVLGAYADRAGRKASLLLSIRLMMVGTVLMAIVPTYRSIGVLAPVCVLVARLLQGFSVGGEFGSATSFLVEHGGERRGLFASFQWAGQGLAALLASAFGVWIATALTQAQADAWGWRIPYVFGLLVGPAGFYIRRHIGETPAFVAAAASPAPVRELVSDQWDRLLLAIGASVVSNSANYLILYMPTYAATQLRLPPSTGFIATLVGGVILAFGAPVFGHWSDRVGRRPIMIAATGLFLVSAYPAFWLLTSVPTLSVLVLIVCWLSLLKTAYSGVLPSLMAELFPTRTRGTGVALSYSVSVMIFGGFAPFFATLLIQLTGDRHAPSFYLMATALISLCALLAARRRVQGV
ncbi:MAG TPA: MFS transporter [Rhodopila sp.]|jgi:MHS family proline/betaine transporter-like MFS transporter|nr:MFS transporter [Rhodopila sp.]